MLFQRHFVNNVLYLGIIDFDFKISMWRILKWRIAPVMKYITSYFAEIYIFEIAKVTILQWKS